MWKYFHRNYLYLLGTVSGIAIFQQLPAMPVLTGLATLIAVLLIYKRQWREIFILLLASAIGFAAAWFCQLRQPSLNRTCRLNNVHIKINDPSAMGKNSAGELLPRRVRAILSEGTTQNNLMIYFPQRTPNPGVAEGEIYQISGNFYPFRQHIEIFQYASSDQKWHDQSSKFLRNSYSNYLQTNNISGTLVADKIRKEQTTEPSIVTVIRRSLTERLNSKLSDIDRQSVLAAITLGIRSTMSRNIKNDFTRSGLAHLFSVSGLHVGVLAALLLLIVRPLPLALHWLLITLLSGYVLISGGQAPAIRAFLMILLLEFFKSRMLRLPPLQLLSLICTLLLIINPYYMTDAGFQYSFIITALLIASAPIGLQINFAFSGPEFYWGKPNTLKNKLCNIRGNIAAGIFFAAVATAGTGALMLYHQNIFFAGSILINILILPILMPLFVLSSIKMIFPEWQLLNTLIELMLDYMLWLVEIFSSFASNNSLMHISAWMAAVLVVILAAMITAYRWKYCAVLLACGLLFAGFLVWRSAWQNRQLGAVICGGSLQHPMAAIILPQAHTMSVLNANYDGIYPLADIAAYYGISQIEQIYIDHNISSCSNGLQHLLKMYPTGSIYISKQPVRSQKFKEHTQDLYLKTGAEPGILKLSKSDNATIKITPLESGNWQVQTPDLQLEIPRTFRPRAYIFPL